ncbi:tripartite tricarboxylate transporter substrate binding protein [Salibacterium qingdaonense]|uniref:Tripartite-type tricarboxylate transporter, receptor component TctC n=1 Tax=Salibacterium qingdaonense TaxID=266892 RepID=A0A1I4N9R1_9BACI|nr:tripartite tricarboxylate transporter substrate binding protein [Salibacterium qingdaonense]SFM12106.1 Tripartite-type tricarboxylate transporter, receptor component TctC [Salibacterium qingdaonense]
MRKSNVLGLLAVLSFLFLLAACGSSSSDNASGGDESGNAGSDSEEGSEQEAEVDYPTKPIEIVVPWAAGGSSDQTARALAEAMSSNIDQNVTVTNREGAGGTIATAEVAQSQPDAHTILLDAVGVFTTQPHLKNVQYSIDDFKAITGLTYEPIVLAVNADSPWDSIEDLAAAKEEGTQISYGHSGAGGLPDLAQAGFFDQAGIEAESIAYEGQNPAVSALLGGHVDTIAAHPGSIMQHVESGDIKILGVFSPERYEELPDVPTFEEKGYSIDMSVWKFLLVSEETPDDVKNKLTEIVEEAMASDSYQQFLEDANLTPMDLSGEEVVERLKDNKTQHGEIIENMGLSAE